MEELVPFKVYTYWQETSKPEVRRFGVEKSVVTSFHYLNAKLQDVFPGLRNVTYSVAWKDGEGDDVLISSDDEVMIALAEMYRILSEVAQGRVGISAYPHPPQATAELVIKLYVYVKDQMKIQPKEEEVDIVIAAFPETSQGGNPKEHIGVVCDGCDSQVVGFRYKCAVCYDFDLCSKCEGQGKHSEHCMVRVPTPTLPRDVIKAAIKRSRQFFKTVTVNEECPYKRNRRDKSGERKHGDHGNRREHHRRHRTSWLETFATYMNEFANLAGDVGVELNSETKPSTSNTSTSQAPEQPKASEAATTQATPEANPEQPPDVKPPQCPFNPEQINVENIQKLLQLYLGNIHTANAPSPSSADVEMGQGDRRQSDVDQVSVHSGMSSASADKRETSPDKADDWTVINKEKDLMDAAVGSNGPEPMAPIGFNLPEEFQNHVNISGGQSLYPPLNATTAVLNPQVPEQKPQASAPPASVPQQTATQRQPFAAHAHASVSQTQASAGQFQAAAQAKAGAGQPTAASNPGQTGGQQRKAHPNPAVEAALKTMLNMGFNDEGGWLTQLLESTAGNIEAVLELLTPVQSKK